VWAVPAQAGRPLVTEDAGVVAEGAHELETLVAHWRSAPLDTTETSAQWAYGLRPGTQLALRTARTHASDSAGYNLELNGKQQLLETGDRQAPSVLTLAWALTASRADGRSIIHSGSNLSLVFSTPVAGGSLHLNLGHQRDEVISRVSTLWNLAYEHAGWGADRQLQPMVEVFGEDRSSRVFVNAALRWSMVPERLAVDGSIGREWRRGGARLFTVGLVASF
jgi:hypothetical protein